MVAIGLTEGTFNVMLPKRTEKEMPAVILIMSFQTQKNYLSSDKICIFNNYLRVNELQNKTVHNRKC